MSNEYFADEKCMESEHASVGDIVRLDIERLSKQKYQPDAVSILGDGEYEVDYVNLSDDGVIVYKNDVKIFLYHEWYCIVKHASESAEPDRKFVADVRESIQVSACGKTAEYLDAHPEIEQELINAVKKHVDAHPEIQEQLKRQTERLKELHMWRMLHE